MLEPSAVARGQASSRAETGEFVLKAQAVIVTSGGIGGNHELVRKNWPARLGTAPKNMICGVPAHVDGRMLAISRGRRRGRIINPDRMWHYIEGIQNWNPIWPTRHPHPARALVAVAGRDAASACRCRCSPASTRSGTLEHIMQTGHDYTWFVLTQKIIEKEFALSGSEQNPDLTGKSVREVLSRASARARPARSRRSSSTAPTSSSSATSPRWCAG